jgi:hypothetical protein
VAHRMLGSVRVGSVASSRWIPLSVLFKDAVGRESNAPHHSKLVKVVGVPESGQDGLGSHS